MKKGIKTILCVLVRLKEAESFVLFQKKIKNKAIKISTIDMKHPSLRR